MIATVDVSSVGEETPPDGMLFWAVDTGLAGDVEGRTTVLVDDAGIVAEGLEHGPELVDVTGYQVLVLPPLQEAHEIVTICTRVATTVLNEYVAVVWSLLPQVAEDRVLGQPTTTVELVTAVKVVQVRMGEDGEVEQGVDRDEEVVEHGVDEVKELVEQGVDKDEELVEQGVEEDEEVDEQGVDNVVDEDVEFTKTGQGLEDVDEVVEQGVDDEDVVEHGVDEEEVVSGMTVQEVVF